MTTTAVSSSPTQSYQQTSRSQDADRSRTGFADFLAAESQAAAGQETGPTTGAGLSVKNVWNDAAPHRQEQERFLELFQENLEEVLSERGLSQTSVISDEQMKTIHGDVADKMYSDMEAIGLMTLLQIDLRPEGTWPEFPNGGCLDTDGHLYMDVWHQKRYEALGPEKYKEYLDLLGDPSPKIPGFDEHVMLSPSLGREAGSLANAMIIYDIYKNRIHNEVVAELGLDPTQMEEGSPEAVEALRLIGERMSQAPEGREIMRQMGLTHLNHYGMPTAPGYHHPGDPEPRSNPALEEQETGGVSGPNQITTAEDENRPWEARFQWNDLVTTMMNGQSAWHLKLDAELYPFLSL